ncbi:MAG: hypothetical protein MK105_13070 [Crocinitomicaceae bacterium]|nr:hypothetical protein [Crocinitomicaceae bacterium]
MATTKQQLKIKQILEDIKSEDPKKVSKAIKSLESHGDASVIIPLAEALISGLNRKNEEEIIELLSSLKDTSAVVEIMEVIGDSKFISIRPQILSVVWNTQVDFSDYIDDFVEIAVTGNLMEAVECATIIDNLEGPFMEENMLECQLHLKNYLESGSQKDEHKAFLLSEIAIKIKDINEGLDAED